VAQPSVWGFIARIKPRKLKRVRKKGSTRLVILSEARSLSSIYPHEKKEILRFAQNDKVNYFFRSL
jgi:hypothetical protein